MVNRGRSKACITCKERRVKCDAARPGCNVCLRLKLPCGGYRASNLQKVRFKHYSTSPSGLHSAILGENTQLAIRRHHYTASPKPALTIDGAESFFLTLFGTMGRDMGSTHGFFELLAPAARTERPDSAFSLALSVVSTSMLDMWRHATTNMQTCERRMNLALRKFQIALQSPNERGRAPTLLAILLLQFHENMAAVFGLRSVSRIHHHGISALLPILNCSDTDAIQSTYIRRHMFHIEVSLAFAEKRPVSKNAYTWLTDEPALSPTAVLDLLGAEVANFRARYAKQSLSKCRIRSSHNIATWRQRALQIGGRLLAWKACVPATWHPTTVYKCAFVSPSMPLYQDTMAIYPSCQIASIWNLWRSHYLAVLDIVLATFDQEKAHPELRYAIDLETFNSTSHNIQLTVDSICQSIPFYLGNRQAVAHIDDLQQDANLLLGYNTPRHSIETSGESGFSQGEQCFNRKHIVAQGPWHALGPLTALVAAFQDDQPQRLAQSLRSGQETWIREQLCRVFIILNISTAKNNKNEEMHRRDENTTHGDSGIIATTIQKASMLSGGP